MTAKALTLPGGTSQYLVRPAAEPLVWGWHALTWRAVFELTDLLDYYAIFGAGINTTLGPGNDGWLLYSVQTLGQLKWRNSSDAGPPGGAGNDYSVGVTLAAGELCDLIITVNPGVNPAVRFYRGGFNTQNAMGATNLMADPTTPFGVGYFPTLGAKAKIYEASAWNRVLTMDEIRGLQCGGLPGNLTGPNSTPYYPDSGAKVPSGLVRLYTFNDGPNDESGGPGTTGALLTEHGGPLDYSADTVLFGVPEASGGTPPSFIASMVGSEIKLDFAASVLDSSTALDPTTYAVTAPVGKPAVAVTGVRMDSDTEVYLAISGDVRRGGTYNVAITDAARVFDATTGTPNEAGVNDDFSITPVTFQIIGADPLPPYPSTKLRVRFARDAKQVSSAATDDALRAANYSITWAGGTLGVTHVDHAAADQVDLTTAAEVPGVAYTLTPANIKSVDGDVIVP